MITKKAKKSSRKIMQNRSNVKHIHNAYSSIAQTRADNIKKQNNNAAQQMINKSSGRGQ